MGITEKSRFQQVRRNINSWRRARFLDAANRRRYGIEAPRFAELLWLPAQELQFALHHWSSKDSGKVMASWPDTAPLPITELLTVKACLAHWRDGLSWEETGIVERMMAAIAERGKVDRLRSLEDIRQRYLELDVIYEGVKREGRLRPRASLIAGNFREEGGMLVHIGPGGTPYFGGRGNHRLAMMLASGLQYVPAQLGCVHIDAIATLQRLRQSPEADVW